MLLQFFRAIIAGIILAVIFLAFVISPARVSGASMLPSIQDRSIVLLVKVYQGIEYGDVVAIDSRTKRDRTIRDNFIEFWENICNQTNNTPSYDFWVKRIIGLPGDILEIKDGQLYRNGNRVTESYILEPMRREPLQQYVVPEGCVFVLGDNRNDSVDSREIGSIPIDHVLGKVIF